MVKWIGTPSLLNLNIYFAVYLPMLDSYNLCSREYIHDSTRKMVPICLRASSFPKSMSNNKHEQIQNQYAIALPHLLVSNRKKFIFVSVQE